MSAHQPRKGFIAQLEGFSRLQKCKENPEINKFSLHFCSSEGRNELDIKECVRLKKTLMTRRHTEDFQMRAWTHALKKSSRKRIFKAFRSPLCGFRNNNCQKAVVEDTLIMILINDEKQAALYQENIKPNLTAGKVLMFAHSFNIHSHATGSWKIRWDVRTSMLADVLRVNISLKKQVLRYASFIRGTKMKKTSSDNRSRRRTAMPAVYYYNDED